MDIEAKREKETERKRKQRQRLKEEGGRLYQTKISGDQVKAIQTVLNILGREQGRAMESNLIHTMFTGSLLSIIQIALESEIALNNGADMDDVIEYVTKQIAHQPDTYSSWRESYA